MQTKTSKHFYTAAARNHWNTIVVGGGQAGLAAGYYLQKIKDNFIILDASARAGDSWRLRWDSMRLFTPYNDLPGWSYPAKSMTKDQMAEYLELYVEKFSLPLRSGVSVRTLSKSKDGFLVETDLETFTCNQVVVATGTNQFPYVPVFSFQLDPAIVQVHSAMYRNHSDVPYGNVLVVGSAVSGIEIAMELSKTHHTMLAGKPSFIVPSGAFRFGPKFYWWFVKNILTIRTPIGRKVRENVLNGGGVIPQLLARLQQTSVEQVPRVTGVKNGMPLLEDGQVVPVAAVIWCTGYRPDFGWIDIPNVSADNGWPVSKRGISTIADGLYFVGVPFQFGLSSGLVAGVGRDAEYIIQHMRKQQVKLEKI